MVKINGKLENLAVWNETAEWAFSLRRESTGAPNSRTLFVVYKLYPFGHAAQT
jgi:hypothetical protein